MEMPKSLLQRARPELVKELEDYKLKQPVHGEVIVKYLSETYWIHQLTWGHWVDLQSLWLKATKEYKTDPWDLFED